MVVDCKIQHDIKHLEIAAGGFWRTISDKRLAIRELLSKRPRKKKIRYASRGLDNDMELPDQ